MALRRLIPLALSLSLLTLGGRRDRPRRPLTGRRAAATARLPRLSTTSVIDDQKRVCAHDDNSISALRRFAKLVARRTIDCAQVYGGTENWAAWDNPWFTDQDNLRRPAWVRHSPADDHRLLIISEQLIPTNIARSDWLARGAAGDYAKYAAARASSCRGWPVELNDPPIPGNERRLERRQRSGHTPRGP